MRVIHGVWAHGALCLWAEDPDLPPLAAAGAVRRAPATPASVRLPGRRAGRHAGRVATRVGRHGSGRRGPQGRPRRADPAAAFGRRRPAGLARARPPGGARDAGVARRTGSFGGFGSGQARPGIAGELAGARARPRPRRRARAALWFPMGRFRMGRFRPAGRRRDRRRVADLPGRGGPFRGRPGRARPGAARARIRWRWIHGAVAPGARRCRRAARP